jgi:CSLREA domain-containing protein
MATIDPARGSKFVVVWVVAVLVADISAVHGTTITVDSPFDGPAVVGNCSLREAVTAANTDTAVDACPAGSNPDVIVVPAGVYVLTHIGAGEDAAATGDLDVTDDVEIQGAGAGSTHIVGNGTDRVFDFDPGGTGVTAALSGITVRGGGDFAGVVAQGGGIRNRGTLTVTGCEIRQNRAEGTPAASGGGIHSDGTLGLTGSRVFQNLASSDVLVEGGGIANNGSATITNSTIELNVADAGGSGPSAGGGGISSNGPLTITGTTIQHNVASVCCMAGSAAGGGIATTAQLALTNSTITSNRAENGSPASTSSGGAMALGASATINNATIADNGASFGAVATSGIATVTFRNTIVADSDGTENCDTALSTGTIVGNAYNLDDDDTCGFSGTDLVGVDPHLGPLQDNCGPTVTHSLLAGSPAFDAGSPAAPGSGGNACEASDQRGFTRPQFARCDIGSVELEIAPPDDCPAAPLSGCATPGKSLLLIKDRAADGAGGGDKLIWKWLKGPATAQQDFGDPTETADYRLCIYTGTTAALQATIPADGRCGVVPLWKTLGTKGYKRSDTTAGTSGISKILLKGSEIASSKIIVKGKDGGLDLEATTLPLDGDAGITVQLSNSDNPNCWQSTYAPASVTTNSESVFKAKVP